MSVLGKLRSAAVWTGKKLWRLLVWLFRDVALVILRLIFLVVTLGLGVFVAQSDALPAQYPWA